MVPLETFNQMYAWSQEERVRSGSSEMTREICECWQQSQESRQAQGWSNICRELEFSSSCVCNYLTLSPSQNARSSQHLWKPRGIRDLCIHRHRSPPYRIKDDRTGLKNKTKHQKNNLEIKTLVYWLKRCGKLMAEFVCRWVCVEENRVRKKRNSLGIHKENYEG